MQSIDELVNYIGKVRSGEQGINLDYLRNELIGLYDLNAGTRKGRHIQALQIALSDRALGTLNAEQLAALDCAARAVQDGDIDRIREDVGYLDTVGLMTFVPRPSREEKQIEDNIEALEKQ